MSRFARQKDINHGVIVAALRAVGCSVAAIESGVAGVPDLIVGVGGRTHLVEVKPLVGETRRRELRESQVDWHSRWRGAPVVILRTKEDAVEWASKQRRLDS